MSSFPCKISYGVAGGGHSHSSNHHESHGHHDHSHSHSDSPSHSHSIQDLSVGLSVLGKYPNSCSCIYSIK